MEFDDEYMSKWFKHVSDYYYGNEEISAFTGKKETTLRSIYSRGRTKLIERLRK